MTHDAGDAALVGIDWADTKHDFCIRATGSEQEEYGVIKELIASFADGPNLL
jgi:hypothetical protein